MLSFMRIKQLLAGLVTQRDVADARCVTKPNHNYDGSYTLPRFKSVSARVLGSCATYHLTDFNELCQFKGSPPKLKKTKWFLFWFFPRGDRPPPWFFLIFTKEIASKKVKCMKLYYCDGITLRVGTHIFTSLNNVSRKYQLI